MKEKKCALCGKLYNNKRYKYCSIDCCVSANHIKQTSILKVCLKCGKEFQGQKKQKYCSDECARRVNTRTTMNGKTEKRCTVCMEWKQLTECYHKDKSKYDGYAVVCKLCSIKKSVARSKTKHGKELRAKSRIRNIETIRRYTKQRQPLMNEREKIRSKTDLSFQLNRRMRCLLWKGLRENKGGQKWQDLTGYTIADLKKNLQRKFTRGMTWERFMAGEIHIDHKIPRSAFNYSHPEDYDFKKCWSLRNLQPMWAEDNLHKSDRLDKPYQPSLAIGG